MFLSVLIDVVVPNGTIYSHVAMIDAPITLAKGWKEDLGLFGGGAALTPGAGICQSSTTLYRAVLLAGLPIVEFKSHSLFVDHYEFFGIGLDATVFPGTHDFRFRNDTGDDLVIQAYINYPTVTLNIFGKPTGRTVKMKGPYFAGSKNRPAALPPLSTHQIGWVREITYPDGKVTDEKRISTYAKPLWHSLTKKYIGADGAKLLVTK
jgi:vancomycin resistance protein YoaR